MMQRVTVAVVVMAVGAWGWAAHAEAQTNFSGTWVQASSGGGAAGGMGGGGRGRGMGMGGAFGERVVVTQDATTLKATNTQPDGTSTTFTYLLDGSESRNSVPGRQGGEPIILVSKATWAGDKLSIATTINLAFGGNAMTFQMTDVLSLDGDTLTVQSTRSGMRGGEPTVTVSTYKKAQ
ncbi:MAG TPA: hypothetical protein VMM93_12465 [Vicinamibacterales bacterium]|nr:hypothetical protein [Vicinamibacterales bacterium]